MDTSWGQVLVTAQVDGPTLTAAAAASMSPPHSKFTLPANFFDKVGKQLVIRDTGRISCVVTTPGTARYDVRFGATVVADSLALGLNVAGKTNEGWWLDWLLTARAVGTSANLFVQGRWNCAAYVNDHGHGSILMLPLATAPAVGANFDSTIAQVVDQFFTQTVATGSHTLHQYQLISPN